MSAETQQWPWKRLNESNASAHDVLATLLEPEASERWLDVGTGGGGLAFALARRGAEVVGVDVSEEGLAHARETAAEQGLAVDFRPGDAQELPFEDGSFDGVASAFGAIFAPDHERAAAELARVCRAGGKLGMTLMPMDSRTGKAMTILRRFGGGPPTHPGSWSERVDELMGEWFDLDVKLHDSSMQPPPPLPWDEAVRSIGSIRELVEQLDEERVAALRAELEQVDDRFADRNLSYFVVLGVRR
jgi:SAM-dependent methyltransferase